MSRTAMRGLDHLKAINSQKPVDAVRPTQYLASTRGAQPL